MICLSLVTIALSTYFLPHRNCRMNLETHKALCRSHPLHQQATLAVPALSGGGMLAPMHTLLFRPPMQP